MLQAGNGWLIATLGEGQEKEREEERGERDRGQQERGPDRRRHFRELLLSLLGAAWIQFRQEREKDRNENYGKMRGEGRRDMGE